MEMTIRWEGGSTLISNNTDLKTKAVKKYNDNYIIISHNIMIKGSI